MPIPNVTERGFRQEVLQEDGPVLVTFRAAWCSASRDLEPTIDEVAARFSERIKMVAVDVEADPKSNRVCRQFAVTRLPMVMMFRDGRVVDFVGGATSADTVASMLERELRPVLDVNEFNFEAEVLKSRVPVLVHVHAAWCSASLALIPDVEATAKGFAGRAKVVRLEYGPETARLCARFDFRRVPTLAVFERGRVADQILGGLGAEATGDRADAARSSRAVDSISEMLEQVIL